MVVYYLTGATDPESLEPSSSTTARARAGEPGNAVGRQVRRADSASRLLCPTTRTAPASPWPKELVPRSRALLWMTQALSRALANLPEGLAILQQAGPRPTAGGRARETLSPGAGRAMQSHGVRHRHRRPGRGARHRRRYIPALIVLGGTTTIAPLFPIARRMCRSGWRVHFAGEHRTPDPDLGGDCRHRDRVIRHLARAAELAGAGIALCVARSHGAGAGLPGAGRGRRCRTTSTAPAPRWTPRRPNSTMALAGFSPEDDPVYYAWAQVGWARWTAYAHVAAIRRDRTGKPSARRGEQAQVGWLESAIGRLRCMPGAGQAHGRQRARSTACWRVVAALALEARQVLSSTLEVNPATQRKQLTAAGVASLALLAALLVLLAQPARARMESRCCPASRRKANHQRAGRSVGSLRLCRRRGHGHAGQHRVHALSGGLHRHGGGADREAVAEDGEPAAVVIEVDATGSMPSSRRATGAARGVYDHRAVARRERGDLLPDAVEAGTAALGYRCDDNRRRADERRRAAVLSRLRGRCRNGRRQQRGIHPFIGSSARRQGRPWPSSEPHPTPKPCHCQRRFRRRAPTNSLWPGSGAGDRGPFTLTLSLATTNIPWRRPPPRGPPVAASPTPTSAPSASSCQPAQPARRPGHKLCAAHRRVALQLYGLAAGTQRGCRVGSRWSVARRAARLGFRRRNSCAFHGGAGQPAAGRAATDADAKARPRRRSPRQRQRRHCRRSWSFPIWNRRRRCRRWWCCRAAGRAGQLGGRHRHGLWHRYYLRGQCGLPAIASSSAPDQPHAEQPPRSTRWISSSPARTATGLPAHGRVMATVRSAAAKRPATCWRLYACPLAGYRQPHPQRRLQRGGTDLPGRGQRPLGELEYALHDRQPGARQRCGARTAGSRRAHRADGAEQRRRHRLWRWSSRWRRTTPQQS